MRVTISVTKRDMDQAMAENSKIEWTDHTFNPWIGCQKVSAGCQHCYAEQLIDLRYGKVKWGPTGTRQRTSEANWKLPLKWNEQAKREGRRARVFCASLADVFEDREEVIQWRANLFAMIERTRNLDWLLLTKRPENVCQLISEGTGRHSTAWLADCNHVWIGTSIENQETADTRIPHLLQIPAAVRFLSIEPLLGPIDLLWLLLPERIVLPGSVPVEYLSVPTIDWVIVGGESGQHARPMHPELARSLRDQCVNAGVPYFFKQWGEWIPYEHDAQPPMLISQHGDLVDSHWLPPLTDHINENINGWMLDDNLDLYRNVGKKSAGRLLDGREWNEVPEVTTNDS